MKSLSIIMPYEAEMALNMLNEGSFDAYVVGGCVRDSILGLEPGDWDITTSALPDEIIKCFDGYRIIETGLKHGTVAVIINKFKLEITTYRIDGKYIDNRRPDSVEFTDNISLDLERRDFTMNALAYKRDRMVDLFGGISDIEKKLVKSVGNPDKRFNEDGLRILRALRFASVLGFDIEKDTLLSIHKNRELLKNISSERISAEFNKLITGINFGCVLIEYADVIAVFIPEIMEAIQFNDLTLASLWNRIIMNMENVSNDLIMRLAAIFCGVKIAKTSKKPEEYSDDVVRILQRLKYDRATVETVRVLVLYFDEEIKADSKNIKLWLNKVGKSNFDRIIMLKKAYAGFENHIDRQENMKTLCAIEAIAEDIINDNQCYSLKNLAVNGLDLIEAGINEGQKIGDTLNELLNMVIEEKLENKKENLLNYIKNR